MVQIYGSTAGLFLVLAVLTGGFYIRNRERAALGLTGICAAQRPTG